MTSRVQQGSVQPPVVVLNTHYSGLGIARNLGPLGIRVIGLTNYAQFPGNRSRWLEYRPSADSLNEPEALLVQLLRLHDELGVRAVLFPTRDHDIQFINRYREQLEAAFVIPFAAPDVIDRVMNKDRLFAVARSVGIAVPEGVTLNAPPERELARRLRYPCICKPLYAAQWRKPGIWEAVGRQKAVRVDSYPEFAAFYDRFCAIDPLVTVQEWVPGGEENLQIFGSYCGRDHEVRAFFTARKRLQYPELIGTGIVVEALPLPEIEEPSRALLRALEFFGVSEIEYKLDARDGRLYLIEVNPRHWDQHRLGTAVGVNLSLFAYLGARGEDIPVTHQHLHRTVWIAEQDLMSRLLRHPFSTMQWRILESLLTSHRTWSVLDFDDLRPTFHSCLR